MITVRLQLDDLDLTPAALPVGARLVDSDGDTWTKLEGGRWQLGKDPQLWSHLPAAWGPYTAKVQVPITVDQVLEGITRA